MLVLMQLMSGTVYYSVGELAEKMETSTRTIYRYIDTFRNAGYVADKVGTDRYRLIRMPKFCPDLKDLVYFTEQEARLLVGIIRGLREPDALKGNLCAKLSAVYDVTGINHRKMDMDVAMNVSVIEKAVRDRRQMVFLRYRSAHSDSIHDARVEPYSFSDDHLNVYVYDLDHRENRIYKIARIGEAVCLQSEWQHQPCHQKQHTDCFRMSGPILTRVKLGLDMRAMSLLVEEYPDAVPYITPGDNGWILDTMVTAMEGVGRFVLGLAGDIEIIDSPELSAYMADYVRTNLSCMLQKSHPLTLGVTDVV